MNGFSTEEDSHDGPPAPPFYGQSCCLIEDGERCGRSAGNASFSKRIQKSISQKKLKLDIDKSVSSKRYGLVFQITIFLPNGSLCCVLFIQ